MVLHHVLSISLGDVGDIVPSGLHELVKHNSGCLLVKLQEYLGLRFIVELVCREGGHVGLGTGLPLPSPLIRSFLQVPAVPKLGCPAVLSHGKSCP